jgi:hypothetical protein
MNFTNDEKSNKGVSRVTAKNYNKGEVRCGQCGYEIAAGSGIAACLECKKYFHTNDEVNVRDGVKVSYCLTRHFSTDLGKKLCAKYLAENNTYVLK